MPDDPSRRPIKTRSSQWATCAAQYLTQQGVTPNGISATSLFMAACGALAFIAAKNHWITPWLGFLIAPIFIQARLICNLLDGMVAIEGGKSSPTGPVWNEVPDRFADTLLLVAAGIAADQPWAGASAAWASVMTAYIRSVGAELTHQQDFTGPFAKPHRMAMLTIGSLLVAIESSWKGSTSSLAALVWIIAAGTLFTTLKRLWRLSKTLQSRAS
jgi:phosphatidylglycerophosphate synthase